MMTGMRRRDIVLTLVGLVMFVISSAALTKSFNDNYELYVQESECVAKHIKLGVERRDIVTGGGTCYVR